MSANPPSTLGKYQIIREIARSNDIVYEGYDPVMNRRVAVKELSVPSGSTQQQREDRVKRFLREAKAAGSLVHPNIVTVYDVAEENGRFYLAMEYLDGQNLRKLIDTQGFLDLDRAIEITTEVLKALSFAHQNGVVHRDVKPENIQILENGAIKLTDFGIARLTFEPNITMDGQVFGTPSYMSPEQINGRDIDPRSDIFSIGVVLYEMVSGTKPFTGDSVVSITYAIMNREPDQPARANHTLWQILRKTLDKSPALRYENAEQLITDLRAASRSLNSPVLDPLLAPNQPPPVLSQNPHSPYPQSQNVPHYLANSPYLPYSAYAQPGQPGPAQPLPPNLQPGQPPPGQFQPGQPYNTTPYQPGGANHGAVYAPYPGQTPYGQTPNPAYQPYPASSPPPQIPVYYPPPPRGPLISSETKSLFGRFFLAILLVGALIAVLLVGLNTITRALTETASNSPPTRVASNNPPTNPPGTAPDSANTQGNNQTNNQANNQANPPPNSQSPTPQEISDTLATADAHLAAGAAMTNIELRQQEWARASSLYSDLVARLAPSDPDTSEEIRAHALGAFLGTGLALAPTDPTAARQALYQAQAFANDQELPALNDLRQQLTT